MQRILISFGALALITATPAAAGTLTYSDRTQWTTLVTGLSNFDSGTQTIGTNTNFGVGGLVFTSLQIQGVNIVSLSPLNTQYSLLRVNAGASESYYNWNSGAVLRTVDKTATNTVFARLNFATPISAFGFNYGVGGCQTYFVGCTPGAAASVTISPGGMTPININTSQGNTMAFWGVVSDTQTFTFADIYINDTNRYIVLDDIAMASYSTEPPPAETAEPGTLLQIAMGAGLLALARRRFQTQFI
jgi:hypothetical protein